MPAERACALPRHSHGTQSPCPALTSNFFWKGHPMKGALAWLIGIPIPIIIILYLIDVF